MNIERTNRSRLRKTVMKLIKPLILMMLVLVLSGCEKNGRQYDASGTFEATEIVVSAEGAGKITSLAVSEGQICEAGQQTGEIDSSQLKLQINQLQATIRAIASRQPDARKQIDVIRQQITTARNERQRTENLVKANAANQKQLDDYNSTVALLEKQLAAQQSTLDITSSNLSEEISVIEAQIAILEDKISRCRIINPVRGTILAKYAEAGEITTHGKAIYRIADLETVFLRAYITSGQLTRLKIGQQVSVLADSGDADSREYNGTLVWVADKAEFTPKTIQTRDERANLVYAIKIAIKNDGLLKIGMYGDILLQP